MSQTQQPTFVESSHILLQLACAGLEAVEWCQADVTFDLRPLRNLVDVTTRAMDLGGLHCGGCGIVVLGLLRALR